MFRVKYLIVLLLLCSNAMAWDEETGFGEGGNETYEIIWNDEFHCFEHKNMERPYTFNGYIEYVSNIWFTIKSFFITTVGLNINYDVDKYEWDGSAYQETDSDSFSWDLSHNANHTETSVSTFDPVEEYFKGNESRAEDWNGDDPNHPDILNVSVTIDGNGESLDDSNYGYVTMPDNVADGLVGGETDYGFGTGRGANGGSGGIYQGLNVGYGDGDGDTGGMGDAFKMLFWLLIPLIFILCVIKMIGKIL